MKRVFLIVLDGFGIGAMEDAPEYGDEGTNTIASVSSSPWFHMPNMKKLGLFNIDGVFCGEKTAEPAARIARMREASRGKDTTIGHWGRNHFRKPAACLSPWIPTGRHRILSTADGPGSALQQALFRHGGDP